MISKEFIKYFLALFLIIELLSFVVYLNDSLRLFVFVLLCLLYLFVCLKDLRYGVYISLAELILGSKGGYLFYIELGGSVLSIRIALWLILLSVYLTFLLKNLLNKRKIPYLLPKTNWLKYFGIFFILLFWGLINGFYLNNSFSNIFLDFNGFLYFLLIFPVFSLLQNNSQKTLRELSSVFVSAVSWISFKTLLLLYLFSHNLESINSYIYAWTRNTGVGEITKMSEGLYRIFFQSHIFVIFLSVVMILWLLKDLDSKYNLKDKLLSSAFLNKFLLATTSVAVLIISLSRSNWIGIILAFLMITLFEIYVNRSKGIIHLMSLTFFVIAFAYLGILTIINFPFPSALGGFDTHQVLSERASDFKNEAGVSSRWNLLPELGDSIKSSFFLGKGFGSTVTYISNDPRVRENNPDGTYTTFAFEWGWLDFWLKMGLLGVLSYIVFFFMVIKDAFDFLRVSKKEFQLIFFLVIVFIVSLSGINFFSPYLNHPLGIGTIIYSLLLLELAKKESGLINSCQRK